MGTLESLNVSQEIFFDAPTDLLTKEFKTQHAKPNISEWRNSVSVEELNAPEKERILKCKLEQVKSKASQEFVPMQSALVQEVITKEKEEKLEKSSRHKEKSDLNLIFQQSKNISEVLLSNKEGKLRTIKPTKTNIKPKLSTKEAVLVKQISLDDMIDEFSIDSKQPACINQDLVQSCSILIEQNEQLDSEDKYKSLTKSSLISARTTLSESQLYLASVKDQNTNEQVNTFKETVDEQKASIEPSKFSMKHLTVKEMKPNEKEQEFKSDDANLQNAKIDSNLREDQSLLVLEQNTFFKEIKFDQLKRKEKSAKSTIDFKNVLEINQPVSLEKELTTDKLEYNRKTASISQDKLNELHISDIKSNEKESTFIMPKSHSTKVLPIAQADLLLNYDQQSHIAQLDERKTQGNQWLLTLYQ